MQNENNKNETLKESKTSPWLDWAVKLQAIAQAGLTYGKDVYDRERDVYKRQVRVGRCIFYEPGREEAD